MPTSRLAWRNNTSERGNASDARKLAAAALTQVKNQPRATYVMAQLLRAAGDEEGALRRLQAVVDQGQPDPQVAAALGRIYFDLKDFSRSAKMYELAHRSEPYERQWLVELARVYVHAGNPAKRIETLKQLVPTDADDLDSRKRLAGLLEKNGDHQGAERYAREALEIDVVDAGVQKVLGDALLAQKKYPAALEAYRLALEINANADDARLGLAHAYLGVGDRARADEEARRVILHDPDNAAARRLHDRLTKSGRPKKGTVPLRKAEQPCFVEKLGGRWLSEPRTERVFERSKRPAPDRPLTPLEDSLRARLGEDGANPVSEVFYKAGRSLFCRPLR